MNNYTNCYEINAQKSILMRDKLITYINDKFCSGDADSLRERTLVKQKLIGYLGSAFISRVFTRVTNMQGGSSRVTDSIYNMYILLTVSS